MAVKFEGTMTAFRFPHMIGPRCSHLLLAIMLSVPAYAQDGHAPEAAKPKAAVEKLGVEKAGDADASRYCANVAPSIAEARIAWQTKRLAELDAQVRQRIADLEKAEAAARDWIARRDALMKTASGELVAIYGKMQPESAARQIGAMDDQTAAALLAKLKPNVAGAILDEMEAERASRLAILIAAAEGKKS
jgi:flagellar motility protein MotE (MotC chaperone)